MIMACVSRVVRRGALQRVGVCRWCFVVHMEILEMG